MVRSAQSYRAARRNTMLKTPPRTVWRNSLPVVDQPRYQPVLPGIEFSKYFRKPKGKR